MMPVRSLGFLTDLMVLRAGGSSIAEMGELVVVRTAYEPDYWWGNFVLVLWPERVEEGLRVFRREFPAARHLAIGIDGISGEVPATVPNHGLEPDISAVLTAPALAPAAHVDAEVRELSNDADWEDLFELRMQDDYPGADASFQRARVAAAKRLCRSGTGFFLGAFRRGQLVSTLGIVSDGSGAARFQHVQTHLEHRRQGLASHLTAAAAGMAHRRWPIDRLVIVADPKGPAIGLYRALGFRQVELQVQLTRPPARVAHS